MFGYTPAEMKDKRKPNPPPKNPNKSEKSSDAYDPLSFTNPVNTVLLTSILSNSNDCGSSSSSDSSSCGDQ